MPRVRKFTEVEDFYIAGHIGRLSVDELSEKLSRKPNQITKRIKELDLENKIIENSLKNKHFGVKDGAVVMTQAAATDKEVKEEDTVSANKEFEKKYAGNIHRT